jgi:hypothetical protein
LDCCQSFSIAIRLLGLLASITVTREGEIYLGGLTSADLIVKGFPGNGIHITNKRLILVRSRPGVLGSLLGGAAGGILGGVRSGKSSRKETPRKIQQLEKNKYLELYKEEITSLELTVPAERGTSRLLVTSRSVGAIEIWILAARDHEAVKELMNSFYPEALKMA